MSLVINTNVSALNAYQNLNNNQNMMNDAIEKLSSGLRINKASDDAAGLSISQGLTSQINGLTQAVSNAQDGTDVAQIADGALGTAQQILQRMRTLVVQAANSGTQDDSSLSAIGSEITSLNSQLTNISTQTKYGATNLLDGTFNGNFQVGANGGDTIGLDLTGASTSATSLGTSALSIQTATAADVQLDRGHRRPGRDRRGHHHGLGRSFRHRCDGEPAQLHGQQPADRDHQRHGFPVEPDRRRPGHRGHLDDPGADPDPGCDVGPRAGQLGPAGDPEAAAVVARRREPRAGSTD